MMILSAGHGRVSALVLGLLGLLSFGSVTAFPGNNGNHMNLLMVGNSFSEAHNMEEMIQHMLNERKVILQADSIFAARFEQGGANMAHYAQSEELATMIAERPWRWVVLQEQSQTPGFYYPSYHTETYNISLASVLDIDLKIQENGATTILFETWGYFGRDPINPDFYTDYQTMQDRITRGYELYKENILKHNPSAKVKIAPAGLAFNRIFNNIKNDQGKDPLEKGSLFDLLFDPNEDGLEVARKHPTTMGSYLCGCVLFQTLTGLDVRQSSFTPPGMDVKIRKVLQAAAYDTVIEYQGSKPAPSNPWYSVPTTPPPYVPSDSKRSSGSGISFAPGRWLMTIVLLGGVGMLVWSKRRQEYQPYHRHQPLNQSWDLLPSNPNMELTDMPGGYDGGLRTTML